MKNNPNLESQADGPINLHMTTEIRVGRFRFGSDGLATKGSKKKEVGQTNLSHSLSGEKDKDDGNKMLTKQAGSTRSSKN